MAVDTKGPGLDAGRIRIPVEDGELPGYQAMPANGTAFPVILVVPELFGVDGYIEDVCRRLAQLGYLAVAPELFWRQGDVSAIADDREIFENVVSQVPDAQVMADLDRTAEYATGGRGDPGRVGITGFCWGGRIAWLYAAHSARVRAAVAWYGRLRGDRDELHPQHPVDVAARLCCPVLGLYGAEDRSIPLDSVEQMRSAITGANRNAQIIVYPEAGHAFHADARSSYHPPAARDAWQRMREWFRQYDVG